MVVIFKIIALAVVVVVCIMLVRQYRPEMAISVEVVGAVILLGYILSLLKEAFAFFDYIISATGVNTESFAVLLKIIGIGYLTEFSVNLCTDFGNSSIASKVLLAGKLSIFVLSVPIIREVVDKLVSVIQ